MYELKAGACEAGINPPEELFPFRKYENSFFEGCLDELKAKAIVLDNGATRFLILGMDVGETLNGEQKAEITKKYGFDYEHILTFNPLLAGVMFRHRGAKSRRIRVNGRSPMKKQ